MSEVAGDVAELGRRLGVRFADEERARRALVHRSWAYEHGGVDDNERLELLGDAVVSLAVARWLLDAEPDAAEGRLAKVRAQAVRTSSLADAARGIGLGELVLLGRGEQRSGGAQKDSILADTFEAVVGAWFREAGFEPAAALVLRLLEDRLAALTSSRGALDAKTALQEQAAAQLDAVPEYAVDVVGPDHERTYTARVGLGGREVARGSGRSKKQAEQAAAAAALETLSAGARQ